jgi:formate dehydrogenase subunit gamma
MAATTSRSDVPTRVRLGRFVPAERVLHWVNATMFGVLIATGAILYIGALSALVGRRELVRLLHVTTGLLLPVPLIVARFVGPWRDAVAADIRDISRFDEDDRRWLRSLGRRRDVRMGKFHPGQKLNAAFTLGAILVMLLTGSIMHWFRFFPVDWRTGATFVHDWFALAIAVVIAGHLRMAYGDRVALRGMTQGWVPRAWARHHRPKWYEAMTGQPARNPSAEPVPTAAAPATPAAAATADRPPQGERRADAAPSP